MKKLVTIACGLSLALVVASCRENEQGRPLSFDKGNYAGPADTPLTEEQLRALQQRGRNQAAGGL